MLKWKRHLRGCGVGEERLRTGLRETYAYHRATEQMMSRVLADARDHPVMAPYHEYWRQAVKTLVVGWPARGRQRTLLRAGIALALSFDTWHTLTGEQGLTDKEALELVLRLVRADGEAVRSGEREASAS